MPGGPPMSVGGP